jgi:hypothetical protein
MVQHRNLARNERLGIDPNDYSDPYAWHDNYRSDSDDNYSKEPNARIFDTSRNPSDD